MNDFVIVLTPWMQGFIWAFIWCSIAAVGAHEDIVQEEDSEEVKSS